MPPILSDPPSLIGLILIILLVVGVNLAWINMLRGKQPDESVWGRALGGARRVQRQQAADYDKLHQMVTALSPKAEKDDKPHE
jgi:hypothetical protein